MQKGLLPEAATSSTSGIGGSAGMFGPLDMMCGWPLVNTTTWPASSGIAWPPTAVAKHRPVGDDVIRNQMIGARQDFRQDLLARRRADGPGVLGHDLEEDRAGEAHGF